MTSAQTTWRRRALLPVRVVDAALNVTRGMALGEPVVLMYHHIASTPVDPWELSVSPEHFEMHLRVLRRSGRPLLTLGELAEARSRGQVPRRAVAVTFDDGYADNLAIALPLLERAGVPATVFVTTAAIDSDREMWWDELERIILLSETLPAELHIDIEGETIDASLAGSEPGGENWKASIEPATSGREELYLELWRAISRLPHDRQRSVMDELVSWAGIDTTPRASHRMLTSSELVELAASDLIEIGSHSVTHASLTSAPDLEHEVRASREELERRANSAVTSFAYPSGHHDDSVVAAVGAAGYRVAATTSGSRVRPTDHALRLPRYRVTDKDERSFWRFLVRL